MKRASLLKALHRNPTQPNPTQPKQGKKSVLMCVIYILFHKTSNIPNFLSLDGLIGKDKSIESTKFFI